MPYFSARHGKPLNAIGGCQPPPPSKGARDERIGGKGVKKIPRQDTFVSHQGNLCWTISYAKIDLSFSFSMM